MVEIFKKNNLLNIKSQDNKYITINISSFEVFIEDMLIDFPWEYEKWWILAEVKEYEQKLFYNFLIDWKVIFVLFYNDFELKEDILSFFWDIDVLLVLRDKKVIKIIENIEAKYIIPFGEQKNMFLNLLSLNLEEQEVFKLKWDFLGDNMEFVNLK